MHDNFDRNGSKCILLWLLMSNTQLKVFCYKPRNVMDLPTEKRVGDSIIQVLEGNESFVLNEKSVAHCEAVLN